MKYEVGESVDCQLPTPINYNLIGQNYCIYKYFFK